MKLHVTVLKKGRQLRKALVRAFEGPIDSPNQYSQIELRCHGFAGGYRKRSSTTSAVCASPPTETTTQSPGKDSPSVQRLNGRASEKHADRVCMPPV